MRYRTLGRTGLEISEIGLGTEHLVGQSSQTVEEVIHLAADRGVTYFDILVPFAEYRDNLGRALRGIRNKFILAGHIGIKDVGGGRCEKTREVTDCEPDFHDLLRRLGTDHVDVVMIQHVDAVAEFELVMGPGGMWELAERFVRDGKARFIGMSTHNPDIVATASESGRLDVVMHSISLAYAPQLAGTVQSTFEGGDPELSLTAPRHIDRVFEAVRRSGVGLVAMKPFGGGQLLKPRWPVKVTPAHCLAFVLSHPEIACSLFGVRNTAELIEALKFLEATNEEKDFRSVVRSIGRHLAQARVCNYCGNCQPCPVGIHVGETLRFRDMAEILDIAQYGGFIIRDRYEKTPAKASDCTGCGECTERCPFGVDVVKEMARAVELLAGTARG